MGTIFKYKGNIEGEVAVCNISTCSKDDHGPNRMFIPKEYCTEINGEIHIAKKAFNRINKKGLITYK